MKIKNSVINADFSGGTANWNSLNAAKAVTGGVMRITGDGTGPTPALYQATAIPCTIGRKIYVRARARVITDGCTHLRLEFKNSTGASTVALAANISNPIKDNWYDFSYIATITTASNTVRVYVRHNYASSATANGKVMEVMEAVAIDLTEDFCGGVIGTGKEPTQAWCDANIPYFEGELALWEVPVTDRLLADVLNKTSKGFMNYTDLNRIEQNCAYLAAQLVSNGYPVSLTVKTDWIMDNFFYRDDIDRIRDNVNTLINAFHKLPGSPDIRYWDSLDFADANSLEQNILNINTMLQWMAAVFLRCGDAYGGDR